MKTKKLVYGLGVNDVDYVVQIKQTVNGKQKLIWICPYYNKWMGILERCSFDYHLKHPTYFGCDLHKDWKYLSNFIKWVDSQPNRNWQNCEPDKDLLSKGNKYYAPDTVVFVERRVNNFLTTSSKSRGDYMIGCSFHKATGKYMSRCMNPFSKYEGQGRHIGIFNTELEAHKAWQAKKHEDACQLADLQEDPRVADALRQRYAPDKDWTKE